MRPAPLSPSPSCPKCHERSNSCRHAHAMNWYVRSANCRHPHTRCKTYAIRYQRHTRLCPFMYATRSAKQTRDAVRQADTRRGPPSRHASGPPCRSAWKHWHDTLKSSCCDCVFFRTEVNSRIAALCLSELARDPTRARRPRQRKPPQRARGRDG